MPKKKKHNSHIASLQFKIKIKSNNQKNVKSAVSALSSTSTSFGTAAASSKFDTTNGIDEQLKAQALADEEAAMNQYKVSFRFWRLAKF